jgi:hypothetical protein
MRSVENSATESFVDKSLMLRPDKTRLMQLRFFHFVDFVDFVRSLKNARNACAAAISLILGFANPFRIDYDLTLGRQQGAWSDG